MRRVRLYEHERASVGEHGRLTFDEVDALDRAQRAIDVDAFCWIGRNQIKANQYVGMIATPTLSLEILPKVEGYGAGEMRRSLVRMICQAWNVPIWDGEMTGHECQHFDLLELLMGLFARRLQAQVRKGVIKEYCAQEEDLSYLAGRMNVTRQFTNLAATPQKMACRYDEFSTDIHLNRLLLCAIRLLQRRSNNVATQRMLSEVSVYFDAVSPVSIHDALNARIGFSRINRRWEVTATLARLLLSAMYQTTHHGKHDGIALLFDMNVLFESYVASVVKKYCASRGAVVRTQGPTRCLGRTEAREASFLTRPDIYIEFGEQRIVVDTKWKIMSSFSPNSDVSMSDAYQMFGYSHVYDANAVVLLYPHHQQILEQPGAQREWYFRNQAGGVREATLRVATIDVVDHRNTDASIDSWIWDKDVSRVSLPSYHA